MALIYLLMYRLPIEGDSRYAPALMIVKQALQVPLLICLISFSWMASTNAQTEPEPSLRWYLEKDSSAWLAFHTYAQLWVRVNENNPGTTLAGRLQNTTLDISIRRFRVALQGQLSQRLFIYTQLGINNLNYLSPRGTPVELLDIYAEYQWSPALEIGGGKTAWTGLSRYSAPNSSKLLTYDLSFLPLPTNNETNDLIRKLSLYLKGKIGRLDYRLVYSKPFAVQNSADFDPRLEENIARFTNQASDNLFSGYLKWEFKDRESNRIPFSDGAYLGNKAVLSLGAGLEFQARATQFLAQGDTVSSAMRLWAIDLFWDQPIHPLQKTAFTFYTGYFHYDFGPNFSRNIGVNNPAVEGRPGRAAFNGPGNAFPVVGTGNSWYTQAGFLLPAMERLGQLQPYFAFQYSDFARFDDAVIVYDLGLNWYLNGHLSKFSLNIQNRPVFAGTGDRLTASSRKSMAILQYLIRLE